MNTDTETEITRNVLGGVRQFEIRTNRFFDEYPMGAYRSIFKK
jgi:hypothetical protein